MKERDETNHIFREERENRRVRDGEPARGEAAFWRRSPRELYSHQRRDEQLLLLTEQHMGWCGMGKRPVDRTLKMIR